MKRFRSIVIILFSIGTILLTNCNSGGKNEEEINNDFPKPAAISYSIAATFPHDTSFYTQGLVIYKGQLYEGTGLEGKSRLMKVDLKTGKPFPTPFLKMDDKYFGEGITILNDTLYQLTWQNHVVFMYSLKDFKLLGQFGLATDGWGITTDGKELIVSDGTSNLTFYEPGTFKELRKISVTQQGELVNNVNELEYINGFIYGNRYTTDHILKIDPVTGIVVGVIDFKDLNERVRSTHGKAVDYFNGIAYDHETKKTYVTGKLWPELYEVEFSK